MQRMMKILLKVMATLQTNSLPKRAFTQSSNVFVTRTDQTLVQGQRTSSWKNVVEKSPLAAKKEKKLSKRRQWLFLNEEWAEKLCTRERLRAVVTRSTSPGPSGRVFRIQPAHNLKYFRQFSKNFRRNPDKTPNRISYDWSIVSSATDMWQKFDVSKVFRKYSFRPQHHHERSDQDAQGDILARRK
jgi:hypothetical protein